MLAGTGTRLTVLEDFREWLVEDFERAVDFLHGPDRLFHKPDERTVERSRAQLRATGQAVTRRDFLTCHRFDVRERLQEVTTPTLAIVGEHDALTPPSYHEFLAEQLPDCEMRVLTEAAHLAMVERPTAFNETLAGFFDDSVAA
ncbi:hypothetical protein BRC64_12765 [Halobacteriales archaeon QH_10_67_22]|nr:MAG: hypothetical protein BRC64_12765 [Halobacteriales archaeon QH_10_67_22]